MRLLPRLIPALALSTAPALAAEAEKPAFLVKAEAFPAQEAARGLTGIGERIAFRAHEEPFLVVATVIFVLAILHTFLAVPITKYAHRVQHDHDEKVKDDPDHLKRVSFKGTVLHFLGEVEAIFGIWVLVLLAAMTWMKGAAAVTGYMMGVNFTEPLFVVIIMALASTRPVLRFAESCLRLFARLGKETPAAWWLSILVIAPILGSFITEPGAMTIAAMLLGRKFYRLKPRPLFAYGTLGLLFVNISVGGVLTNFAAPPVLMVAQKWNLSTAHMLTHYGDKAVVAILLSTAAYFAFFRNDLKAMAAQVPDTDGDGISDWTQRNTPVPLFVTITHLLFMLATVVFAHYPPMFIGGFLFFIAFSKATQHHQNPISLKGPILVGFFLGGLVIHGGLQGWWLQPIISSLGEWPLFAGSTILTSFNDNAAITFLASQVEGLTPALKYAVLAGAVTGGGLTVIANAPNPAGQALLARYFGDGVSPLKLLAAALVPTIIVAMCFMLIPDKSAHASENPPAVVLPEH
ncbi:putative Na+/H+ antiporter [Luteolibacter ambystomatis]|uniref:Na+/H+ antiporter n=1 Tax=Luteolibacter ambystomatis TaxID=2824561 RepID=A0A975G9N4_9BACT|nr:putative Na+/H+ antiporter [Luteolibacter ambystomatis]QUE51427.1 putative Na+/H+ antiporter [Luteolibacter ambystomatis]